MGCPFMTWIFFSIGAALIYSLYLYISQLLADRKLQRWKLTAKGIIILHGFPPSKTIPNASPFFLRVETFLRMSELPYEIDITDAFSPTGKTPWISLNGQHISDSDTIIDFLKKTFEKKFDGDYTEEQLSIAMVVRIVLDEHSLWNVSLQVWENGYGSLKNTFNLPILYVIKSFVSYNIKKYAWGQETEMKYKDQVFKLITNNLQAVSKIIGCKKFICGDEPCEQDCGIFSQLAQFVWCMPESPYGSLIHEEFQNLEEYCFRMKEIYWPDWHSRLKKC